MSSEPSAPDIRALLTSDAGALRTFFAAMPAEDRTFFFQDVTDPEVADTWVHDHSRSRWCAVGADGGIAAFGALRPGVDWSSHVAEIVLVVAPQARRHGLGRLMARHLLLDAIGRGYRKTTIMIPADNVAAIDMFRGLGFQGEALLRDHLRSPEDGTLRDTVILAHLVDDTWSTMLSGGIDGALA